MKYVAVIIALIFLSSGLVHAEKATSDQTMAITICPFRLFNPELLIQGEFQLTKKMSAAPLLGAGMINSEDNTSHIIEIGGQFRHYLIGTFKHGMIIGAYAGYVSINNQIEDPIGYLAGIHAGGFQGYKYSMKKGFTVEIQFGSIYLWGRSAETSEIQTLANLKLGWSF